MSKVFCLAAEKYANMLNVKCLQSAPTPQQRHRESLEGEQDLGYISILVRLLNMNTYIAL